jgi:hypothetical protein
MNIVKAIQAAAAGQQAAPVEAGATAPANA